MKHALRTAVRCAVIHSGYFYWSDVRLSFCLVNALCFIFHHWELNIIYITSFNPKTMSFGGQCMWWWWWYLNEKLSFGRQGLNPTLSSPHLTSKRGISPAGNFCCVNTLNLLPEKGRGFFFLDTLFYYFISRIIQIWGSEPNTSLNLRRAEYIRVFTEGSVRWHERCCSSGYCLFSPVCPLKAGQFRLPPFSLRWRVGFKGSDPTCLTRRRRNISGFYW